MFNETRIISNALSPNTTKDNSKAINLFTSSNKQTGLRKRIPRVSNSSPCSKTHQKANGHVLSSFFIVKVIQLTIEVKRLWGSFLCLQTPESL